MNENDFRAVLAPWIRVLRSNMRLTQVQIGNLLGIRPEPVSRWENERETPSAANILQLMAMATPDQSLALIEKIRPLLDDRMKIEHGSGRPLELAACDECEMPLRLSTFTSHGWPAPPLVQRAGDPYAIRRCPRCTMR